MTKNRLLTSGELNSIKEMIPKWQLQKKMITREWSFKNFIEAFGFITKVAMLAETMNHHPNIKNIYSKVILQLTTHDLGGLSNKDIELAKAINELEVY